MSFPLNGLRAFEVVSRRLTLVGSVRFEAMLSGEGFALICPVLFKKDLETGAVVCPFDVSLQTYAFCIRVPDIRLANNNVLMLIQWLESEVERDLTGFDN